MGRSAHRLVWRWVIEIQQTTMPIDGTRMRAAWDELARIGATEGGGVTRLALSDQDRRARDVFAEWCTAANLAVRIDDVGNIYGWRRGTDDTLSPVVMGSHLDTVVRGGRFDGALGVLAALEVVRSLNEYGVTTRHPIVVIDFTNEEGARFEPAMVASGLLAGAFPIEDVYGIQDRNGECFGDELERIGYRGSSENRLRRARAYLELHIEQGPVLERVGVPVGVVTGIQGIERVDVTFHGEANHAGSTPIDARQDALVAAARFITAARDLAKARPGALTTAGRLQVEPDVINVIPERVVLGLDVRHIDVAGLDDLIGALGRAAEESGKRERVRVDFHPFWRSPPTAFSDELIDTVERAATGLGVPAHRMISGPGHDAKYMADIAPAVMIFVRTRHGRSHCEDEWAEWEDCELATSVLLRAVLEIAGAAGSGDSTSC